MSEINIERDDIVGKIIAWESGQMDDQQIVEFFSELVKSGMAWKLQGRYGRTAMDLIKLGILAEDGTINQAKVDEILAG